MDPSSVPPRPDEAAAAPSATDAMDTRHLARFEFSDVGTKILMVEWVPAAAAAKAPANQNDGSPAEGEPTAAAAEAPAPAPAVAGDAAVSGWEVSWPGKSVTLPARDTADDAAAAAKVSSSSSSRRVFFLLPQDSSVPSTVTITPPEGDGPPIQVKPLPAIFPDGFGGGGGQSQRSRGVLHTIWAKKRLRELDHEIDAEMRANAESVGVEMALAERKWIVDTFLPPPPTGPLKVNTAGGPGGVGVGDAPPTPRSPISSGRLGDKLKGLKLATSPADLASPANTFTTVGSQSDTLSPMGDDIAMPSIGAMSRAQPAAATAVPMSLNAALQGDAAPVKGQPAADDEEADLFALPISPRSPDMKKSPFSIF